MVLRMHKTIYMVLISLFCFSSLVAQKSVNVGIYQNAPKIFMDNEQKPTGFFVDILEKIALEEKWELNYVPCLWSECLEMLENAQIDIMPDVAYTQERAKKTLFSQESVLSSWSVLYRHKDVQIDSILDLKDKTIAVLKDSIQANGIKTLLNTLSLKPHSYSEVSSFSEAFELLENKKADCVITNRFYELNHPLSNKIIKTNIVIEPSMIKFTFSPSNNDLANKVDFYLKEFKKNQESVFYKAQQKWMTPKEQSNIPTWFLWLAAGGLILILVLSGLVILFQKLVMKKSQELLQKEELMIIQSRHAAMGEMIEMIAHQWRQPLSIISMSASNIKLSRELEEEITPMTLQEHLNTVSDEVKHLSNTIDDFRNFFRPNKTKVKVPVSYIIQEVKKILEISLKNSNIEFIVQNDEDYEIETFANELLQVVLNLVNNAKDILKEKQISNSQIVLKTSQTNSSYTISIYDNGGGIPEGIFGEVGKQYFTTKSDNGTGLGLYMSIIIVEQHLNGSLRWENQENGACFTISLFK